MAKKLKLIDSHAHLNFAAFDKDRQEVIADSLDQGIGMINVGAAFDTSRKAVELAQGYSRGVWAAVGVHPIHVTDEDFSHECMFDLATNNEKVVAVGETGLDYFHLESEQGKLKQQEAGKEKIEAIKEKQKETLYEHLKLAHLLQKPVIFHCRHFKEGDAHYDLIEVLEEFAAAYQDFVLRGVMHCYTGDEEIAKIYQKLGLLLGFTGVVTFSDDYDKVIEQTPLEQILVETDAPYLSPAPKRGERNVPQNVELVARKIAAVKKIEPKEVFKQTLKNTRQLFGLANY